MGGFAKSVDNRHNDVILVPILNHNPTRLCLLGFTFVPL